MKIGILTYHRAHNYGAMLQAYALRAFLRSQGYTADFIDYWPDSHNQQYALFKPIVGDTLIRKVKNLIVSILTLFRRHRRIKQFQNFTESYLNLSSKIQYTSDCPNISEQYDCVVVGSDQIWRNHITDTQYIGFDPVYFCQNFSKDTYCISYAASMGIIRMTSQEYATLKTYLQAFDSILVRENKLKELVEELGIPAKTVVDPTLLLSKEQWNELLPKSRYRREKYVLYYELLPSPKALVFAQKKAEAIGCKLLIMDASIHTFPQKGHIEDASPINFLHAIRDAEFVIATSFHGTAFSIIFEKQFLTLGLNKNADRVLTLLGHLDILEHYQNEPKTVANINYKQLSESYNQLILQSKQALLSAIDKQRTLV